MPVRPMTMRVAWTLIRRVRMAPMPLLIASQAKTTGRASA